MDLNRFTEKVQEALASAQQRAASGGQQNIDVIHLLVSLLEQEPGLAVSVLRKAGVDVTWARGLAGGRAPHSAGDAQLAFILRSMEARAAGSPAAEAPAEVP